MRVLVTGASGYLGGATIDALLAAGCDVRALVRGTSDTSALDRRIASGSAVELAKASLLPRTDDERSALHQAVAGVDVVAHLAGGGRVRKMADFVTNNVETTRALCDAITAVQERAPGVAPKRVVFVSSMAARGPTPSVEGGTALSAEGGPALGDVHRRPRGARPADTPITAYGRAKLQAEGLVTALPGAQAVILRPPGIYGPGDDRLLPLFRAAKRGWIPLPAPGETASFVYIDDCAQAICDAVVRPWVAAIPYYVEDGAVHATEALAQRIAGAVGTSARIVRVPLPVLRLAATLSEGVAKLRGTPLLLTRDKVRDLAQPHWTCDAAAFRADYGWTPRTDIHEGLQRAAADYRSRGWL